MSQKTALTVTTDALPPALLNAITLWADARTDAGSERRVDLLRDKTRVVGAFFDWCGKHPGRVTPLDVKAWQAELEEVGLSPSTVYARISRLSSFYEWTLADPALSKEMHTNPVKLARPKAPKAYQSESTQALDDDEVKTLLAVVKARDDVVGKRDYALMLFYLSTGMRRSEVIRLRWGDLKINGTIILTGKVKGGNYVGREVADPRVKDALLDYLEASGRLDGMTPETPLWTSHDRANTRPGKALTGHAFVKRLKKYAEAAGIGDVHLHQTRHTYARMVSEDTGSIIETQDALGHANAATTKVYVQRIAVKKDKHGRGILDRLGVAP